MTTCEQTSSYLFDSRLRVEKSTFDAKIKSLEASIDSLKGEIKRAKAMQKIYDAKKFMGTHDGVPVDLIGEEFEHWYVFSPEHGELTGVTVSNAMGCGSNVKNEQLALVFSADRGIGHSKPGHRTMMYWRDKDNKLFRFKTANWKDKNEFHGWRVASKYGPKGDGQLNHRMKKIVIQKDRHGGRMMDVNALRDRTKMRLRFLWGDDVYDVRGALKRDDRDDGPDNCINSKFDTFAIAQIVNNCYATTDSRGNTTTKCYTSPSSDVQFRGAISRRIAPKDAPFQGDSVSIRYGRTGKEPIGSLESGNKKIDLPALEAQLRAATAELATIRDQRGNYLQCVADRVAKSKEAETAAKEQAGAAVAAIQAARDKSEGLLTDLGVALDDFNKHYASVQAASETLDTSEAPRTVIETMYASVQLAVNRLNGMETKVINFKTNEMTLVEDLIVLLKATTSTYPSISELLQTGVAAKLEIEENLSTIEGTLRTATIQQTEMKVIADTAAEKIGDDIRSIQNGVTGTDVVIDRTGATKPNADTSNTNNTNTPAAQQGNADISADNVSNVAESDPNTDDGKVDLVKWFWKDGSPKPGLWVAVGLLVLLILVVLFSGRRKRRRRRMD